jgi:O-antigen/teichoic acid export membrane protein
LLAEPARKPLNGAIQAPLMNPTPESGSRDLPQLSLPMGVAWACAGNFVYSLSQWCMLAALTKLSSPAIVGQFILALAITAPIVLLTNLQLRTLQAADSLGEHRFGQYVALRSMMACVALSIIAAIAVAGSWSPATACVVIAVGTFKIVESFSDVTYGLFQQSERMDYIARSLMIRGPAASLTFGATFYLTGSLTGACLSVTVAWLLIFIVNDWRKTHELVAARFYTQKRYGRALRSRSGLLSIARSGLPLGMIATMWTLNANIPRYLIQQRFGPAELGVFGAIAYIHVAGTTFVGALGQASIPRLAAYFAAGDLAAFRSLLTKGLGVAAALGVACTLFAALFGRVLLIGLYSVEYGAQSGLFTWQMVASGCAYVVSVMECALNSIGCFHSQLFVVVASTALTALSTYLTLPILGLRAVPVSMIAAYILHASASTFLLRRRYRCRQGVI